MNHAPATDSEYSKTPGLEPLPGYRLIEPLGRGGFGEVWKCIAPGGLHKAVKFVSKDQNDFGGGEESLRQEFTAFEKIKSIRHPFLLTLERVELLDDELIMVMELADQHLQDRYFECVAVGNAGVPREELIGYMAEAAEALDFIGNRYGLQHLDIKPANLFITSGHAKVGDYGLVSRFEKQAAAAAGQPAKAKPTRGLTPRYAAPEVIRGQIDPRSDQYSLALVYYEMLTGGFPYKAKSAPQMLYQHATAEPDLSLLLAPDVPVVARALSKDPAERFATCLDFVVALVDAERAMQNRPAGGSAALSQSAAVRRQRSSADVQLPSTPAESPTVGVNTTPARNPNPTVRVPQEPMPTAFAPKLPPLTNVPRLTPPHLRAPDPRPVPPADRTGGVVELVSATSPPASVRTPEPGSRVLLPKIDRPQTQLDRIWSLMSVGRLGGANEEPPEPPSCADFTEAVVRAAAGGDLLPRSSGEPYRTPDGTWRSRVLMKSMSSVVRLKLAALCETWRADLQSPDPKTYVVRLALTEASMWDRFSGKKPAGIELTMTLPPGTSMLSEAELTGRLYGTRDDDLVRAGEYTIPKLMEEARQSLQNTEDQRKSPRVPTDCVLSLFPITGDGCVFPEVTARCVDVSLTGVRFTTDAAISVPYVFVNFGSVEGVSDWCILTKILRTKRIVGSRQDFAGRFRTDL